MASCLHYSTLIEGSSENSDNIYGHIVCSLCRSFKYETKISCKDCEKNVCLECFPRFRNIQLALYLKTCGLPRLYRTYKQFPESADTLFSEDAYKSAVFRAHKEMLVKNAEISLIMAQAELTAADARIHSAKETKKALLQ